MEIEPDGQQFLDARAAGQGADGAPPVESTGASAAPPSGGEPGGGPGGGSRLTIVVVGIVVAVLVAGGVAVAALGGDDRPRELETGPNADVALRERAEATTTTDPPESTTTVAPAPTTTVAPADSVVPFPDFGPPPPPGPAPAPACPGGGVTMVVTRTSATKHGNVQQVDIEGTATNNTTAPVTLDLRLTIDHDAVNHPVPWVTTVDQSRPTLAPGETSTWTFSGAFAQATRADVTALGGGFRWADPVHASCPTQ